jgi:hypothetical protein
MPGFPHERAAPGAAFLLDPGRVGAQELRRDAAEAGALSWLHALGAPENPAAAAGAGQPLLEQARSGGGGSGDMGGWAPSRLAGRPPSLLLDTASRVRRPCGITSAQAPAAQLPRLSTPD